MKKIRKITQRDFEELLSAINESGLMIGYFHIVYLGSGYNKRYPFKGNLLRDRLISNNGIIDQNKKIQELDCKFPFLDAIAVGGHNTNGISLETSYVDTVFYVAGERVVCKLRVKYNGARHAYVYLLDDFFIKPFNDIYEGFGFYNSKL